MPNWEAGAALWLRSGFAVDLFAPLVAFLRFEGHGGDRACIEALQADRLAGFLAVAVGAIVDAGDGGVNLGDELALAIAGAQFQRAIGFGRGAIGEIGVLEGILMQNLKGFAVLLDDVVFPLPQLWQTTDVAATLGACDKSSNRSARSLGVESSAESERG